MAGLVWESNGSFGSLPLERKDHKALISYEETFSDMSVTFYEIYLLHLMRCNHVVRKRRNTSCPITVTRFCSLAKSTFARTLTLFINIRSCPSFLTLLISCFRDPEKDFNP